MRMRAANAMLLHLCCTTWGVLLYNRDLVPVRCSSSSSSSSIASIGGSSSSSAFSFRHHSASFFTARRFLKCVFFFLKKKTISFMILPQVHLRKPCYDFYFL